MERSLLHGQGVKLALQPLDAFENFHKGLVFSNMLRSVGLLLLLVLPLTATGRKEIMEASRRALRSGPY